MAKHKGRKLSEEHKRKIREGMDKASVRKKLSDTAKRQQGRQLSEEHKASIRKATQTEEHRRKQSEYNKANGIRPTENALKAAAEYWKSTPRGEEFYKHVSGALKGRKMGQEQLEAQSGLNSNWAKKAVLIDADTGEQLEFVYCISAFCRYFNLDREEFYRAARNGTVIEALGLRVAYLEDTDNG